MCEDFHLTGTENALSEQNEIKGEREEALTTSPVLRIKLLKLIAWQEILKISRNIRIG